MDEADFEMFCQEVGLLTECRERELLHAYHVGGRSAGVLAPEWGLTVGVVEEVLGCGSIRLTVRGGAVGRWQDLLEVMKGSPASNPRTPVFGFDQHHPNDPRHARELSLRATLVTAHDLAYGEREWREASPVEERKRRKLRERGAPRGSGEPGVRSSVDELAELAGLTRREGECLALASGGLGYHAIGEELGISPRTAQSSLSRAREKLVTALGAG